MTYAYKSPATSVLNAPWWMDRQIPNRSGSRIDDTSTHVYALCMGFVDDFRDIVRELLRRCRFFRHFPRIGSLLRESTHGQECSKVLGALCEPLSKTIEQS